MAIKDRGQNEHAAAPPRELEQASKRMQGSARRAGHEFELPPLPYAVDALEPHMSAETLQFHHGKHHKAYVTKLNELIKGTQYEALALEEIIRTSKDQIFNNAAQTWNHTFFWNCMAPRSGGTPTDQLARAIDASFGSFDAFKDKFTAAAVDQFGSGWAWLVHDNGGALRIETTSNAETPLTGGGKPLLTCDVWEHAYYIDYRNERPKFLKAFWNVVNWDFAAQNFMREEEWKHG
jgi:superoxide dismutase, Fe-Mn family